MYEMLSKACPAVLSSISAGLKVSTLCNHLFHSIIVANDKLDVDSGELRTVLAPMYTVNLGKVG